MIDEDSFVLRIATATNEIYDEIIQRSIEMAKNTVGLDPDEVPNYANFITDLIVTELSYLWKNKK
jgi:hypothetical protein